MKPISTKAHGFLDYIVGILLIAAPWLFGFDKDGAETWVPVVLGAAAILYSMLTDYELGMTHLIPMRTHLIFDMVSGLLLAASPWIFGFAERVWEPHVIVGILEIGVALLTKSAPAERNIHRHATVR